MNKNNMKKLSLYIFLVLMWCNVGFAEERYSELIKKSKTGKGDIIIEVLKESNFAYELEMSFAEECLYELKVLYLVIPTYHFYELLL